MEDNRPCGMCGRGVERTAREFYKPWSYFRQAEGTNFVRIGIAKRVKKHLREDDGCPFPLRLLGIMRADPFALRNRFSADRVRHTHTEPHIVTDWFHLSDKMRTFIAEHCELPDWAMVDNIAFDGTKALGPECGRLATLARPLSLADETFLARGDEWSTVENVGYLPFVEPPKAASRWPGKL
jgi:hypothetical protein